MKERYKDKRFHEKIHVTLENKQGNQSYKTRDNIAILNGSEIVVMVLFVFVMCVLYIVHRWTSSGSKYFFQKFLIKEAALRFVWNVVVPIGYLIKKKDMRKCISDYIIYVIRNNGYL